MILSTALDFFSKPVVDVFSDEFSEDAYWLPSWLRYEPQQTPDLSDLHTVYMQDGILTRDVDVLVEFYDDTTDEYGTGIIQAWHNDVYIGEETIERAYVLAEDGKSSAYILEENLLPICEVNSYETEPTSNTLPKVQHAVADTVNSNGTSHYALLRESELWSATRYSEVAS